MSFAGISATFNVICLKALKMTSCIPDNSHPELAIVKWENGINLSHRVENEQFFLTVMSKLDVLVASTGILTFEHQMVLSVERFDRQYHSDGY